MRQALIACWALFWGGVAVAGGFPAMVPTPDETPVEMNGNAKSDQLLGCYAKFQGPNLDEGTLGPARISRTPEGDYVLRADFIGKDAGTDGTTVSRLMCWAGGFETNKLPTTPLYPPGTVRADAATESAIAGWRARKDAAKAAAMTARPFAPPDAATKRLLEGIWLVDAKPENGACLSHVYGYQTQIEFEFRKSGGRVLIFEPTDLFTAIQISGIERSGDVLVVQARARDGGLHEFMHIRPLAADRLELIPVKGSKSEIAYKCGDPDPSVTSNVSLERLSTIAPPISGSTTLLAQIPGVSDDDLCKGRNIPRSAGLGRSLQFELYGPAHYWLFGWQFWPEHKFAFDFVRSVEDRGDKGLVLHMQEHLDRGPGWDVEAARGKTYDLTILPRGDGHIEIPELATTFARCKPADPAGAGMARW